MDPYSSSYCPNHPKTPTKLRCGRCSKLVCPGCMTYAPVGVRCKKCNQRTQSPTYQPSASHVARAIAVSGIIGVAGGFLIPILDVGSGFLHLIVMAGYGYIMAELVSASANRKRGKTIQLVAAGGVLVTVLIEVTMFFTLTGRLGLIDLLGGSLGIYIAFKHLR